MGEEHTCDRCHVRHAEVVLKGPGGEATYLCAAPECMMAAGVCPSCNLALERRQLESGEVVLECPVCGFRETIERWSGS